MAALQRTLENVRSGRDLRDAGDGDGDGEGDGGDLGELTREELARRAKDEGIEGRSKMSKKELVKALADRD